MIIANADDWGRSSQETDVAFECVRGGQVTSVSAMVFMADSERAAELAEDKVDVGLHLNFCEPYTAMRRVSSSLFEEHHQICQFFNSNKFAMVMYNPFVSDQLRRSYDAQVDEFVRLYGRQPSHINGHRHMHVATNMLLDKIIPSHAKVRRGYSFFSGEKGWLQQSYRDCVNRNLSRKYVMTDHFFSLKLCLAKKQIPRVVALARESVVELMVHPQMRPELEYLRDGGFDRDFDGIERGNFANLRQEVN